MLFGGPYTTISTTYNSTESREKVHDYDKQNMLCYDKHT